MKPIRTYNQNIVSEVADILEDISMKDFSPRTYQLECFRAERSISRDYQLFEREYVCEIESSDIGSVVPIMVTNFDGEYYFEVNGTEYNKSQENNIDEAGKYFITHKDGDWVFDYYSKAEGDSVKIQYLATGEVPEEHDGRPLLPDKYQDELVRRAVTRIARRGAIKYKNEKRQKYLNAIEIYKNPERDIRDPKLERDDGFIEIQTFDYP